jgi:hypothetical protein
VLGKTELVLGITELVLGRTELVFGRTELVLGRTDLMLGRTDLMLGRLDPEEGETVGGVQVPHHGLGPVRQLGHHPPVLYTRKKHWLLHRSKKAVYAIRKGLFLLLIDGIGGRICGTTQRMKHLCHVCKIPLSVFVSWFLHK